MQSKKTEREECASLVKSVCTAWYNKVCDVCACWEFDVGEHLGGTAIAVCVITCVCV